MNKNDKLAFYIFTVILLALLTLSYALGYNIAKDKYKPAVVEKEVIKLVRDTVTIYKSGKIRTIRDTVIIHKAEYIEIKDSMYIAEMDTLTSDSLFLKISYYSPPVNEFMIGYRLPSEKIIKSVERIKEDCNKLSFGIGAGIIFGSKGIDIGVIIGGYYKIF